MWKQCHLSSQERLSSAAKSTSGSAATTPAPVWKEVGPRRATHTNAVSPHHPQNNMHKYNLIDSLEKAAGRKHFSPYENNVMMIVLQWPTTKRPSYRSHIYINLNCVYMLCVFIAAELGGSVHHLSRGHESRWHPCADVQTQLPQWGEEDAVCTTTRGSLSSLVLSVIRNTTSWIHINTIVLII